MDYAGASFGTLGATYSFLSAESTGAITDTARIPGPVDYIFLGGVEQVDHRLAAYADLLRDFDRRRR